MGEVLLRNSSERIGRCQLGLGAGVLTFLYRVAPGLHGKDNLARPLTRRGQGQCWERAERDLCRLAIDAAAHTPRARVRWGRLNDEIEPTHQSIRQLTPGWAALESLKLSL